MPTLEERLKQLEALRASTDLNKKIDELRSFISQEPDLPVCGGPANSSAQALREGRVTPCMMQDRFATKVFDMERVFPAGNAQRYFETMLRSLFVRTCDYKNIDGIDPQGKGSPREEFNAIWKELVDSLKEGKTIIPVVNKLQSKWVDTYVNGSRGYRILSREEREMVESSQVFSRTVVCAVTIAAEMGWLSLPCEMNGLTKHVMAYIFTNAKPETLWCTDSDQLSAAVKGVMRYEMTQRQPAIGGFDMKKCNPRVIHLFFRFVQGAFIDGQISTLFMQESRDFLRKAILDGENPSEPFNERGEPTVTHLYPAEYVVENEDSPPSVETHRFTMQQCVNMFLAQTIADGFRGVQGQEGAKYVNGQFFVDRRGAEIKVGKMLRTNALAALATMPCFSDFDTKVLLPALEELKHSIATPGVFQQLVEIGFCCFGAWCDGMVHTAIKRIRLPQEGELFVITQAVSDLREHATHKAFQERFHSNCGFLSLAGSLAGVDMMRNAGFVTLLKDVLASQWILGCERGLSPLAVIRAHWPSGAQKREALNYVSGEALLVVGEPTVKSMDLVERATVRNSDVSLERVRAIKEKFCKEVLTRQQIKGPLTEQHARLVDSFADNLMSVLTGALKQQRAAVRDGDNVDMAQLLRNVQACVANVAKQLETCSRLYEESHETGGVTGFEGAVAGLQNLAATLCNGNDNFRADLNRERSLPCVSSDTTKPQRLSNPSTESHVRQADTSMDKVSANGK